MSLTSVSPVEVTCTNEAQTKRLAETLGLAMRLGDLVTLAGDLGAGKTTLTRALIRASSRDATLEVPSPTFTLVQTYDNLPFGSLAHVDLYRLEEPEELLELGLEDALATGVVLVEWPQKAQGLLPAPTLAVDIETCIDDDTRIFRFTGEEPALIRLRRSLALRQFLDENGYSESKRFHLTGDASTRSYETIVPVDGQAIIAMNAPPQPDGEPIRDGKAYSQVAKLAEDMHAFVGVGQTLVAHGFRAPVIYAHDLDQGYILMENLGSGSILNENNEPIADRYLASIETLAAIHNQSWDPRCPIENRPDHIIPKFDREAMQIEVDLLADWYAPFKKGKNLSDAETNDFHDIWNALIDQLEHCEVNLVLRDFHSPNIIWIDGAKDTDRIGIIDFQDALIGPTAYDVACIAQDARADVPAELEEKIVNRYCQKRAGLDEGNFRMSYAVLSAQRVTKVLGIFVRLSMRDGKDAYLAHLPRMEDYLNRSLKHPVLADYRAWVENALKG